MCASARTSCARAGPYPQACLPRARGNAQGGFFRIRFGQAGVGNPSDTYGLKYEPSKPPPRVPPQRVSWSAARQRCYEFRPRPSDYVSKVA